LTQLADPLVQFGGGSMAGILITSQLTRKNTLAILDKLASKELMERGGFWSKKYFKVEARGSDNFEISLSRPNRGGMQIFERYQIEVAGDSSSSRLNLTRIWDFDQKMQVYVIAALMLLAPIVILVSLLAAGIGRDSYLPLAIALGLMLAGVGVWGTISAPSESKKFLETQLGGSQ
jgi:hypothetical protein